MRVSDTERQRAIDELRRHGAAGRLDVDEYATRIEAALAATTLEDLDQVLGDLPMLRIVDPAGAATAGNRTGGGNGSGRGRGAGSPLWGTIAGQPGSSGGGRGWPGHLAPSAVVIISVVVVVLGAVALAAAVGWSWAAVLVGGWLLGLIQSRLSGRGHRGHWR
jgi:hypothetical protein